MIFLLGGRKNPAARAVVGALLVVAGILVPGGTILIAVGIVLMVWGGAQTLRKHRIGHGGQVAGDGPAS